ncbi:hypothetical protein E2N92_09735 [Methanofollis formosanus]|uniref:PGF-CTERM sorting domain-containing protein n=1 Tax=Methanofollis formosanus TaxID=299308 RepID=A0A8G1A2U4_9EURY|nr:hypothetical protein [Methanofollis formosanus]QYZ79688.1 hypothetical protein E2N92_09735 [Methanofollis formosanus]
MVRPVSYLVVALVVLLLAGGAGAETTEMINIDAVEADAPGSLTITGTTNIAPGNTLQVEVTSSAFEPTAKDTEAPFYGVSGTAIVEAGEPLNTWELTTDADLPPDEYTITVEWVEGDAQASTTFTVTAEEEVTGTVTPTTSVPETPVTSPTAPTTTPTEASVSGAAAALGLIGAMLFIRRR